ncbi:deoxynucleotidyltransferase terminal-interacting protein 1 isoform X2 [Nilaparvata lugens]|uniref:deoxynucleotidyltransferase terminal-interacting protein 1 isoform X2 n=1 Tax=Nilaparvata lugens TaxID=108931 RepID=UPI00193E5939|nr:deoxynucleotidyltransferase terminal-interacting protein 1 isoform X2 [Nilaparvata lugens]
MLFTFKLVKDGNIKYQYIVCCLFQKNTFNMRQVILNNLPNAHARLPSRHLHQTHSRVRGRGVTNATKSLDILRQNLQTAINKEIDCILKKYLEKFFKPAVENIRGNLGMGSVTEEHMREVCRAMLDEAKLIYSSTSLSRGSSPFSDSETASLIGYTSSPLFRKRKESDTDSDASNSIRRKRAPIKDKWDPARITKNTLFIMSQRANKVLGLGKMRGRLLMKHPDLFKYCGDGEDRDWLKCNNLAPPMPLSCPPYIMLLDEIRALTESDEYRDSPNLVIAELKGFELPEFILAKIRLYMSQFRSKSNSSLTDITESAEVPNNSSLGVECVSSTMTPPGNALESAPSTPSESALDLLSPHGGSSASSQLTMDVAALLAAASSPGSDQSRDNHDRHHEPFPNARWIFASDSE